MLQCTRVVEPSYIYSRTIRSNKVLVPNRYTEPYAIDHLLVRTFGEEIGLATPNPSLRNCRRTQPSLRRGVPRIPRAAAARAQWNFHTRRPHVAAGGAAPAAAVFMLEEQMHWQM